MTERAKIIQLAVEIGIAIQDDVLAAICEPPTWNQMDDFYKLAQREAFEQAAKVCDEQQSEPECPERARYCAEAIRQLIKE